MSALTESTPLLAHVRTTGKRVAMFEPHPAGHAHMRYSAPLIAALAEICQHRQFSLLVSPEGADEDTEISGVEIERTIQVPLPLTRYGSLGFGILDRCLHWGRADRQIVSWVRAHRDVELVHYQDSYGMATLWGLAALRRLGVHSLLTVHNVRPHGLPWWQPAFLKDMIDRIAYRHFDALLVHSDGLKRLLIDFLGAKSPAVYVVPHGVGEPLKPGFLRPLVERLASRQLLFIGAPRPNKGLSLLLEALRLLPEYSLTVAGFCGNATRYGKHLESLIASAREAGCRIDVKSGFVPDEQLDALLRTHSAVMLPYGRDFRAQSGVLSQAIAYRVPVVATDVGAVGDTVLQFGLGCVVPPDCPKALAGAVRRLYELDIPELATRLEAAAVALAWTSVAPILRRVYDAI